MKQDLNFSAVFFSTSRGFNRGEPQGTGLAPFLYPFKAFLSHLISLKRFCLLVPLGSAGGHLVRFNGPDL